LADAHLVIAAQVLWVLIPTFVASATATIPRGRGPPLDLGRAWPRDGRRLFGPSKTWSGFLFGAFIGSLVGLLESYLILIAPPDLAIVPQYGSSVVASLPLVLLLTVGGMTGDALGSFVKRRLGRPSGSRAALLDQLPMVLLPIAVGSAVFPSVFVATFFGWEAVLWFLLFTLGLHALFNYIGFKSGLKTVPW
jgi:CDP-2,3-bis-(O-geranylgeranyl)-sn-glycerol synthase